MTDSRGLQEKFAALAALGFQRSMDPEVEQESVPVSGGRVKVTATRPSMGTLVAITAVDESRDRIQEAAGYAFREMDRVVGLLNRYDSASAVGVLNAEGEIRGPPPELFTVLSRALAYHRASAGAFDPTVQPLVDLFRVGGSEVCEAELLEAISRVDASGVEMAPRSIRFQRPGMGLTLDGIAKGHIVDCMAAILEGHGLTDFLINAGGDIRSRGVREDGQPWQVGVQDPRKEGQLPDVLPLSDGAVATSGSYEIYYDPERTHHHIVSAEIGGSPRHTQSVSVIAPTALEADALATSVFVMTPGEGRTFIDTIPTCACLIVDREGRKHRSSRWPRVSSSTHPKAETS